MPLLKVVIYPSKILQKKAKPVQKMGEEIRRLIRDMVETMFQEDGVGLAAPQVSVSKRIIVYAPTARRGEETALINPEITKFSDATELGVEGCLSLPGITGEVRRAKRIEFRAMNLQGKVFRDTASEFAARVLQHEIDHLNGVLLIDRLDFNQREILLSNTQRL